MPLLMVLLVVLVVLVVGLGVLVHRRGLQVAGGPSAWGIAVAGRVGSVPGAVLVWVVGFAVTAAVCLGLGFLAKAVESGVDHPAFRWISPRVHEGAYFTKANEKLTMLGNNPIIQLVALVSVIILGFAYRRRWWIPVVGILVAVYGEKYLQKFLGHTVDRGHPPTTLGTFPSGGVGRILAVYGAIIALVILLIPGLSRAWRAGLWTGLATGASIEAYTRVYLSKHWLTDALFGLPFGALLMLTNVAAISALALERADRRNV